MEAMKKSPMKGSENPAKLDGKVVVITGNNACSGLKVSIYNKFNVRCQRRDREGDGE